MSNRDQDYIFSLSYPSDAPVPPEQKVVPAAKSVKPLQQQITELMRSLPPQQRDRAWSMAELVQRLEGKYRARPHSQEVGQALQKLGWLKERRWARGWDGARVWLPVAPGATDRGV
jgi:hypothetical protein